VEALLTVRRLHLPLESIQGTRGLLGPEARRYLEAVLRLAPGARVEVFDGRGGRYDAHIEPGFEAVRLGPREDAPPAEVEIALVAALAKGDRMELIVQKATELGVARILPFAAERSVVRLDAARADDRAARWRRIAEQAARQCGRADVPEVRPPGSLPEALAALAPGTRTFVFHPGGGRLEGPGAASVAAVVGPEGGLTDGEVQGCEAVGAVRAGLGPRTLRAETAAIVAVALLQARFGDLAWA
jgi:16S rRNA (uracil1498-N3)-methyltransferase